MTIRNRHGLGNDSDISHRGNGIADGITARPSRMTSPETQLEIASYIESMGIELRQLAKSAGLHSIAYFLEMVRIEASVQVEHRLPRRD